MTFKVLISNRTASQLESAISYISLQLKNKKAAKRITHDFEEAFNTLERNADSFALCRDYYLSSRGYRKYVLQKSNYVIIYKIENKEVFIAGIFHVKEDYISKL